MDAVTAGVREQALMLGSQKSLVAILTPALGDTVAEDRPCIVILNAGIIHRVGPNRLHVETARALAAVGYTCLRFDLSGIGDSDKRADGLAPLEATLADVREVIDWLESSRAIRRVILIGLCSGADHGLLYAGSDPRVVGLVLLDPSIPRTRGHAIRYYGSRALRVRNWRRPRVALLRILDSLRRSRRSAADESDVTAGPSIDSPQVRAFLRKAYQQAIDQGVAFLAVFTADRDFLYNYRGQMLDALKGVSFGAQLQLEFFSASDHTFASEIERASLIALILKWIQTRPLKSGPAEGVPLHHLVQEHL